MLTAAAQHERTILNERQRQGIEAAKALRGLQGPAPCSVSRGHCATYCETAEECARVERVIVPDPTTRVP